MSGHQTFRLQFSRLPHSERLLATAGGIQSFGSGMPTAVCWQCVCCSAFNRCSSLQQSCRNTAARLRRRGLSDREKRIMHCTTASSVTSQRDDGVRRFISVVMADRTVSSLRLDRQLVTRLIPPLCRMMSRHSGSMLRLQRPPRGGEQKHPNVEVPKMLRCWSPMAADWIFFCYSPIPNSTKFSFSSLSMSMKRSGTWSSFRKSMFPGS